MDRDGNVYLALREGNAIYRIDAATSRLHHVAGTGETGYAGDGGAARQAKLAGPKGLALADGSLYVADTENHVIRRIDLTTGLIETVLGTGERGDGPEPAPRRCLNVWHEVNPARKPGPGWVPTATVSLVPSSMRTTPPVVRLGGTRQNRAVLSYGA